MVPLEFIAFHIIQYLVIINNEVITLYTETTISPHEEQISWLINNENCHDKPRTYVGLITNQLSTNTISAYWNEPILSNHSSNITISISGDHNQYGIGQHKITYAARNKDYFIMCQITLYIIGDISEENIYECTNLDYQHIGIIDLIVDRNTFLVIDPSKYTYQTSDITNNPIQVSYITPPLLDMDITCYININWADIGDMISYPLNYNNNTSTNDFIIWKILIIVCTIVIFILIAERIYFYHQTYNFKIKYQSIDNDTELSSLNVNEMDPIQTQFGNKIGYGKIRSLSLSAAGSNYADFNNISSRINSYPFTRSPIKEEFFEKNEIVPLSMNINDTKKIKTRNRYKSVPTNLMSDNVLKNHKKIIKENKINDPDFWENELRVLEEYGFNNKKRFLSMLTKYAVKNENYVIDKKMTLSIVIKILENDRKRELQNDELDHFLENEWEMKNSIKTSVIDDSTI
eukprot:247326_1